MPSTTDEEYARYPTPFQNLIGYAITLPIAALIFIGLNSSFLASEEHVIDFIFGGLAFSSIVLFLKFVTIVNQGTTYTKKLRRRGVKPLTAFLVSIVAVPAFTTFAFYKGLPRAINYFISEPGEITVTVRAKRNPYRSRDCSGKLWLDEYKYFANDFICGVKKEHWEMLESGDKLILVGMVSTFGFEFKGYTIQAAN